MKQVIILFFCFISVISVFAESIFIELSLKNNEKVSIALTDEPVLTFSDGMLNVKTCDTEISYPQNEILMYRFIDDASYVEFPKIDRGIVINNAPNGLNIFGLLENREIKVFSIDGILLSTQLSKEQSTNLDFSNFPSGIYIVTIGNLSYKFVWK